MSGQPEFPLHPPIPYHDASSSPSLVRIAKSSPRTEINDCNKRPRLGSPEVQFLCTKPVKKRKTEQASTDEATVLPVKTGPGQRQPESSTTPPTLFGRVQWQDEPAARFELSHWMIGASEPRRQTSVPLSPKQSTMKHPEPASSLPLEESITKTHLDLASGHAATHHSAMAGSPLRMFMISHPRSQTSDRALAPMAAPEISSTPANAIDAAEIGQSSSAIDNCLDAIPHAGVHAIPLMTVANVSQHAVAGSASYPAVNILGCPKCRDERLKQRNLEMSASDVGSKPLAGPELPAGGSAKTAQLTELHSANIKQGSQMFQHPHHHGAMPPTLGYSAMFRALNQHPNGQLAAATPMIYPWLVQGQALQPPAKPSRHEPVSTHPNGKHLIVDIAETCAEVFPFEEIARRHGQSAERVREIFEAIIQMPLMRCPTDKRRAGKQATATVKSYVKAKKELQAQNNKSAGGRAQPKHGVKQEAPSPWDVAAFMGPSDVQVPGHLAFP